MHDEVTVTRGDQRGRIYAAGGIGYERKVAGIGWVVDTEPEDDFERLVWATRRQAYPELGDIVSG